MNAIFSTRNLIVLGVILLAAGAYKAFFNEASGPSVVPSQVSAPEPKSRTSKSRSSSPSKEELRGRNLFASIEDTAGEAFRVVEETQGCQTEYASTYLPFKFPVAYSYLRSGPWNRLLVLASDYCLQEGRSIPIARHFEGGKFSSNFAHMKFPVQYGAAHVEKIYQGKPVRLQQILEMSSGLGEIYKQEELEGWLNQSVAIVEFRIEEMEFTSAMVPLCGGFCHHVYRSPELSKVPSARLIDVRWPREFHRWHPKGAVNVPIDLEQGVTAFINKVKRVLPAGEMALLYGNDMFDHRPLAAGALLRKNTQIKVGWVWDGAQGLYGIPAETPTDIDGVKIVHDGEWDQVKKEMSRLVFVKSQDSNEKSAIRSAEVITYRHNWYGFKSLGPFQSNNLSLEYLKSVDGTATTQWTRWNRKKPILIYGENRFDWSAVKALIYLRDSGFSRLYWFRPGNEHLQTKKALAEKIGKK